MATVLLVSLAESDRVAPGDDDRAETTVDGTGDFTDLTTPLHTREEFVAAILAAAPGFGVGLTPEEATCTAGALVDALGGPESLQDNSLTPEGLARLRNLERLDTPPNALDSLLLVVAGCGVDLTNTMYLRPLEVLSGDTALVTCMRDNIDYAIANRELGRALLATGAAFRVPATLDRILQPVEFRCAEFLLP